jgi:surface protein
MVFKPNDRGQLKTGVDGWIAGTIVSGDAVPGGQGTGTYGIIDDWDTSLVTDMNHMFLNTSFNDDISGWDVSIVTDMTNMFNGATAFNQDISGWDVSEVTDMYGVFNNTAFNQDISGWNMEKVGRTSQMFYGNTAFNQDISGWDVSNVTNMSFMFLGTTFDQPIGGWNVGNVTMMNSMFENSAFNSDISSWTVSKVVSMWKMFKGATTFNQNISLWNVSAVNDMRLMFNGVTAFTADISGWNVELVTQMDDMFNGATAFTADIRKWRNQGSGVDATTTFVNMFQGATAFIALWGPAGDNLAYFPVGPAYTPTILYWDVSNTCFPAGTLITLDQGNVEIQKIDVATHTINGERIVAVVRVTPGQDKIVRFEKDAFAPNVPSQTFECSLAHEIIGTCGTRQIADKWVNNDTITYVKNTHWDLYNVLLEKHRTMMVYNVEVETLNPVRAIAYKARAKIAKDK